MGERKNEPLQHKGSVEELLEALPKILLDSGLISSLEEGQSIAEAAVDDYSGEEQDLWTFCSQWLVDYLDLQDGQSRELTKAIAVALDPAMRHSNHENDLDDSDGGGDEETEAECATDTESGDEEDGKIIGEGECELCERFIRLTRHHLIPRSTWPRIQPRLQNAAIALHKGDVERCNVILQDGLQHVAPALASSSKDLRSTMRTLLHRTCNICRPCHSMVHKTHDNLALALEYNTVERLLEDEAIHKFCKWASKQRAGKYCRPDLGNNSL